MNPSKRNQTIVSFATALPTSAGNSQALPWQRFRVETDDKLFKQAFQIKTKLFNDLFILINVGFLSKVQSIGSVWLTQKSILILQSCQMEAEWRHPNPFGGKQWYIQIDNGAFGIGNDQRWECCHDQCFERKTKRFFKKSETQGKRMMESFFLCASEELFASWKSAVKTKVGPAGNGDDGPLAPVVHRPQYQSINSPYPSIWKRKRQQQESNKRQIDQK